MIIWNLGFFYKKTIFTTYFILDVYLQNINKNGIEN
jgi:hypothetical protein